MRWSPSPPPPAPVALAAIPSPAPSSSPGRSPGAWRAPHRGPCPAPGRGGVDPRHLAGLHRAGPHQPADGAGLAASRTRARRSTSRRTAARPPGGRRRAPAAGGSGAAARRRRWPPAARCGRRRRAPRDPRGSWPRAVVMPTARPSTTSTDSTGRPCSRCTPGGGAPGRARRPPRRGARCRRGAAAWRRAPGSERRVDVDDGAEGPHARRLEPLGVHAVEQVGVHAPHALAHVAQAVGQVEDAPLVEQQVVVERLRPSPPTASARARRSPRSRPRGSSSG